MNFEDFTGRRFSVWTAMHPVIVDGDVWWKFKNDNGEECNFSLNDVEKLKNIVDLAGKRFGTWVVMYPFVLGDNLFWKAKNDSGEERNFRIRDIEALKSTINLVGKRFGNVTVIEPDLAGNIQCWKCRCACGIEFKCDICDIEKLKSAFPEHMCGLACDFSCAVDKRFGHLKVIEGSLLSYPSRKRRKSLDSSTDSYSYYFYNRFEINDDNTFTRYTCIGSRVINSQKYFVQPNFKCKCDCGNEVYLNDDELANGSCGKCAERFNRRFGNWDIIEYLYNDPYEVPIVKIKCCKCGAEQIERYDHLEDGRVHCGCDFLGRRFGYLTVIDFKFAENENMFYSYKCRCDCGKEIIASRTALQKKVRFACDECQTRYKSLQGVRSGLLTVIGNGKKYNSLKCCCECARLVEVSIEDFTEGRAKMCDENCSANLAKKKFGHLIVIELAPHDQNGNVQWLCRCDCGNEIIVPSKSLIKGDIKSCGCTRIRTKSDLKKTWNAIKQRCFNPNNIAYKNYGGRGITMYPDWVDDFQAFYDYLSQLEHFDDKAYTLDRIDVNGNYEPDNLRWADAKTQARNKQNNHLVQYEGEMITIAEASERSGIPQGVLSQRLKNVFKPSSCRKS